jgi:hypothetical protein
MYKILVGITEQTHLGDLSTDGTKILKWVLKKQEGMVRNGLTCIRMGTQTNCLNTVIHSGFYKMHGIS